MALTASDIAQAIADALKKDRDSLADYWDSLASQGLTHATQEIQGALIRRGFTQAQATAWDRYDEFTRDIALLFCLTRGGALENFSDTFLKAIDRRAELKDVQVFDAGAYVNPAAGSGAPGMVNSGAAVGTGTGALFNFPGTDLTTNENLEW